MKFFIAAFVFFLALGFNVQTLAAGTAGAGAGSANSHHSNLSERMNSLFPEPQKNVANVLRPGVVKLVSPQFNSKINAAGAKIEWSPGDNAKSYHVQVATDPNFKWLVVNEQFVANNSFELASLQPGQKYYWRVASLNPGNDASYIKSLFVSSVFTTNAQ